MSEIIGHYRVLSKLGEGGMGVVFAAADERLQRRVALKMVRQTSGDPQSRDRLWREARAAARVSHPNVCQVFEVGEADGELFVAMELLEGEPLSARLGRGSVPLPESIDIMLAVLAALGAIHAQGIVHRDLKPSNIFLTPHGVKLLDFGLARGVEEASDQTHDRLTKAGTLMGTPHYMSPEQLTGEALDARSDLFAAGAVLYELLTGRTAFPGRTTAHVFHGVLYEPLPSLTGSAQLDAVDRVIRRATAKQRGDRHPDAAAMVRDLRAIAAQSASHAAPVVRRMTRVIVLPFRMLRPDPEIDFLAFSLADAITASLGTLESLVVRSSLAAARWKADAPDLAALASELDVDAAVTGTLLRAGTQVRVAAQLVETPGGRVLWSKNAQVTLNDVFQLQDDLARQIVESLAVPLSARDERLLAHDTPASPRAYEFFLRANELASDPKSWVIARDLYQQALQEDPRYAPAWARLGRVQRLIGKLGGGNAQDLTSAESAIDQALTLNPDLPLAHHLRAQIDIDQGRARDAMVRLLGQAGRRRADPDLYAGLVYACRYCGLLRASRQADAAARRLDPSIPTSVIHTLGMLGEHTAVVAGMKDAPMVVAFSMVALGRSPDAIAWLAEREPRIPPRLRQLAGAFRAMLEERQDEAVAAIRHVVASDFKDPEGLYYLARLLAHAGALDEAVALVERATSAGFYCYPLLATDEWLAPVRDRPAYTAMLDRARHEHELALAAFAAADGDRILGS
jgi:serine/threonine protein kinase/tetratricopeptide (TPR) repeat protein